MTFRTVVENLKIGETASQLSFQRFMEFGYFGVHFSVTRSKAARAFCSSAACQKAGYDCQDWPVIFGIDGLDDALEAIKTGKMQGTVYNDKEDQAMELAKLSVEIVSGKDTNRKHLKEGRYYVSEYCRVDSSNVDRFLK